MQSLDLFLSRTLPFVPGCPDPLARQALVDSAIEFCEETTISKYTSEPQAVTAGVGIYELDLPAQQSVVATHKAWFGTQRLTPVPAEQIDSILAYVSSAGSDIALRADPTLFYESSPGVIGVYPVPSASAAATLSARISTKPIRTATALEDILYTDWADAVVAGAIYRLASMPGQSFTDPKVAITAASTFWGRVNKATDISLRGRIRSSISVRSNPFV